MSKYFKAWQILTGGKPKHTGTEVIKSFTSKIKGQKSKESIIEAGKKFKSKLADEAKKAQEAEFKKKPWKDPKKKWDQALREYVKK